MNNDEESREMCGRPIGVFDSGVGGISVLKEFVKQLPGENFLYYGDSAHAPYGTKNTEEIQTLSKHICEYLYGRGVKAIAVACNTATSAAIGVLRQIYTDIPIIGIEPALKPAVLMKKNPNIIMMATPLTVKGDKLHHLLARFEAEANVYPLPCPGLMEFAERAFSKAPGWNSIFKICWGNIWRAAGSMPLCWGARIIRFSVRRSGKLWDRTSR